MLVLCVVALAVVVSIGMHYWFKKQAQNRREAAYQLQLLSYTQDLKTGMTRKEVEDYFRANKIEFRQMCCVADELYRRHSWDDLIKIGEEEVPWFCRGNKNGEQQLGRTYGVRRQSSTQPGQEVPCLT